MIPKYISDWLRVIESMKNENTYKLAWGRAIVECVYNERYKQIDNKVVVGLEDISRCILKYCGNKDKRRC